MDISQSLRRRIRDMEVQKKAKALWSEHDKNYSREELNILAKAVSERLERLRKSLSDR